ncbi:MFS transporter [Dictyobacter alpinus]|uniref:MFS transporter n=1 Tax=Dictyobacter alpinus TaxID=2014873 RepID=A0A402BFY5_9CHLR|nr:MFS transporter [Dictyobacter alpinus]GCE30299.1 MFS transporter [Dictyobacter alpinus]GCE30331.1 MFS transporter [Dictyobacter alpinus]
MLSRTSKNTGSPALWRNWNYLLLQGGQLVSFVGDQQQFIALPLLILAFTGSPVQAGIAVSLNTIAVIVISPLAGVLADRWNRKRIMLACDAGRMLLVLTIPLAFWFHVLSMLQIYVVVTLAGALGTIFSVANTATLPNIVTREQLPTALSQSQVAYSSVRTLGSLLGGALYTINSVFPFLVNAISFGVSVFSLSFIRGNFQRSEKASHLPLHQTIAEGFSWLWKQPLLRFLTIINGADSLRYGAGYLVILILAKELHTSPGGIGAIFTAAAVGAIIGNIASNQARQHFSFGTITISMLWLEALMFPLYAVAPNAIFMGIIAAAEELVAPIYNIALDSYRLTTTPDSMRGRMSSTVQMVIRGAQSIGAVLGGLLIQDIGAKRSALILGAWLILLAIATTLNKHVRQATLTSPEAST